MSTIFLILAFLLLSKKHIATYIIGTVGILLYIPLLLQENLAGEIPIQLFFLVTNFIGFYL